MENTYSVRRMKQHQLQRAAKRCRWQYKAMSSMHISHFSISVQQINRLIHLCKTIFTMRISCNPFALSRKYSMRRISRKYTDRWPMWSVVVQLPLTSFIHSLKCSLVESKYIFHICELNQSILATNSSCTSLKMILIISDPIAILSNFKWTQRKNTHTQQQWHDSICKPNSPQTIFECIFSSQRL